MLKAIVDKAIGMPSRAEHDQPTEIGAGLNAVFVFALVAFVAGPTDDVRKHPRRDDSISLGPSVMTTQR
jgi:hypothetical protein